MKNLVEKEKKTMRKEFMVIIEEGWKEKRVASSSF